MTTLTWRGIFRRARRLSPAQRHGVAFAQCGFAAKTSSTRPFGQGRGPPGSATVLALPGPPHRGRRRAESVEKPACSRRRSRPRAAVADTRRGPGARHHRGARAGIAHRRIVPLLSAAAGAAYRVARVPRSAPQGSGAALSLTAAASRAPGASVLCPVTAAGSARFTASGM